MPAVLTHKAILLLARDRLVQIRDLTARMISRKIVAGTRIPLIEQRVNLLADAAVRMLNSQPFADVTMERARDANFGGEPDTFAGSISKFAILGCMGPDLPAFAEVFRPGQGWVFDTVHKGTPDYNREAVIAGTTDMALAFRVNALIRIREAIANPPADGPTLVEAAEMRKVNAYVLGHFCHLAGDIIAHPLINDLEWHLGIPGTKHSSHGENEAIIDAAVAKKIFRRASTREGQGWAAWWPTADEVPNYFGDAYADAFKSVYGEERPKGFKDFENDIARFGEPAMTGDFMRSGVKTFRGLVLTGGYDWGYGHWFGMLTLATVPLMFMPLIAYALPYSRQFFEAPSDPAKASGEREALELATLPFQLGSLSALVYAAVLQPFARGAGKRAVTGIVMQAVTLASLIVMSIDSSTADKPEDGIPAWARWLFIFTPIGGSGLVYSGLAIADKVEDFKHPRPFIEESPAGRRQLINLVNMLPLFFFLAFFVIIIPLFLVWGKILGGQNERAIDKPAFWIAFAMHALGALAIWIFLPPVLRDLRIPEKVPDDAFPLRKHTVRLFDDTTLFDDPAAPSLTRYYPSDIRPLARLWWEGNGEMQIRSDRFGLVFKHSDAAAEQMVTAPMAPMTVAEYLQFLNETVTDGDGATGGMAGAVFDGEAITAYLLPSGAAFAGHGDLAETTEEKVQSENAKFRTLGTEDNDGAYVLYHAPKPEQSVKGVPRGTIRPRGEAALRSAEDQAGYDYLIDLVVDDPKTSGALIAKAADLGALLCMGAADHLSKTAAEDDRVYQIFRNWSLDRRRINEWRMIVEGGALSDKTDGANSYDPAMPQGLSGPIVPSSYRAAVATADPAVLAEAEATARTNGWIKTLRDWLTAIEEGEDLLATTQSRPNTPTNRALSRALAYMFDASDPVGGP